MREVLDIIREMKNQITKEMPNHSTFGKARRQAQLDLLDALKEKIIQLDAKDN